MRIDFKFGAGDSEEWGLDTPPRIGDEVYIAGCFWTVSDIRWMLSTGEGRPLRQIYVEVYLK